MGLLDSLAGRQKEIGTMLWVGSILAWVFGILTFFGSPIFGVLLIILGFVLTYMSSVWKREVRHQDMFDALDDKDE